MQHINAISHSCLQSSDPAASLMEQAPEAGPKAGDRAALAPFHWSYRGGVMSGAEGTHISTWSLVNYGEQIKVNVPLNPEKRKLWGLLKLPFLLPHPFFVPMTDKQGQVSWSGNNWRMNKEFLLRVVHGRTLKATWLLPPRQPTLLKIFSVFRWRSPSIRLF